MKKKKKNYLVCIILEEEFIRLKKFVDYLISRTELLSGLLENAGITVPAEPALEKISPLKWSNKINVISEIHIADKIDTGKGVIFQYTFLFVFDYINSWTVDKNGTKKKEKNCSYSKKRLKKLRLDHKEVEISNESSSGQQKCVIENQENHANKKPSDKKSDEIQSTLLETSSTVESTQITNTSKFTLSWVK